MGSMSSGKSTLRRNFCKVMDGTEGQILKGTFKQVPYVVTEYGTVGVVGEAIEGGSCDGLDKSFGLLKKEGGLNSVAFCLNNYEITILEGSQTSSMWIDDLVKISEKYNAKFYAVYLNVTLWQNYQRLLNRIQERGKTEADMTDKRLESVRSKNKQFRGVFDKCSLVSTIKCYELAVSDLNEEQTLLEFLKVLKII